MGTKVGDIFLELQVDDKNFQNKIKNISSSSSKKFENNFTSVLSNLTKVGAIVTAAKGIASFSARCIELGSDLNEVQNVVDTAFPNMNKRVDKFAKNCMASFGLSEKIAKQFMGTFGAMGKSFGFSEKEAENMSEVLTSLAGDIASFYNLDPTEAYTKLKSVFTGETESLKDLGIVMTQSALDQYALANGFGKTTAKMSEQEKVALRYSFVVDKLSMVSGDFMKTQSSWANQTRILQLRVESLMSSLGRAFLPLLTKLIGWLNKLLEAIQPVVDAFADFMEMIFGKSETSNSSNKQIQDMSTNVEDLTNSITDATDKTGDLGNEAVETAKKIDKAFAGVDTINQLTFNSDNDSQGSNGDKGSDKSDGSQPSIGGNKPSSNTDTSVDKYSDPKAWKKLLDTLTGGLNNLLGLLNNALSSLNKIWNYFNSLLPNAVDKSNEKVSKITISKINTNDFDQSFDEWIQKIKTKADDLSNYVNSKLEKISGVKNLDYYVKINISQSGVLEVYDALSKMQNFASIKASKPKKYYVKAIAYQDDLNSIYSKLKSIAGYTSLKSSKPKKYYAKVIMKNEGVSSIYSKFKWLSSHTSTKSSKPKNYYAKIKLSSNNFNSVVSNFKKALNKMIGYYNTFISRLSTAVSKINVTISSTGKVTGKSHSGGKTRGAGGIRKLAQGGYVRANQPQLAMIGDNTRYGEIVAPENKMLDMINTALQMQKQNGNVEGLDTVITLIKELIELVKNLSLRVDVDVKKLSVLLENAKKERLMIG